MNYQEYSKEALIREIENLRAKIQELEAASVGHGVSAESAHAEALFNTIHEPVWSVDRHYQIRLINLSFKRLFHEAYGIELTPGDNFIRYIPVDLQGLWNAFIERALRGEHFSAEHEFHANGRNISYEFTFNPMESPDGRITAVAIIGRETTERKVAERRIRESEKRFRSLVQNSSDIIFVLTEEGILRYTSPSVERILGYSPADITDTDILIYLHPEDNEQFRTHLRLARSAHTENLSFRCRFRRADGSFASIEGLSSNLIHDEFIRGIVINGRDVTDRIGVEQALLESERRFRSIMEDLPAMICRFLPDGTLTFVNGNYCHAFRKTAGELLGKSFLTLIPETDREPVRKKYLSLDRANPVTTYEHRVQLPDGQIRWQKWTDRAILDADGQVIEYQSIGEDITEQKQMTELMRLRSIALDAAANAVMITDRDGNIISVNPAFTKLTGYEADEVIGRNPRFLKSGRHTTEFYKNLWNTILAGSVWHGEMINRKKDGSTYTDRTTITPVLNEEHIVTNFIAIKDYSHT